MPQTQKVIYGNRLSQLLVRRGVISARTYQLSKEHDVRVVYTGGQTGTQVLQIYVDDQPQIKGRLPERTTTEGARLKPADIRAKQPSRITYSVGDVAYPELLEGYTPPVQEEPKYPVPLSKTRENIFLGEKIVVEPMPEQVTAAERLSYYRAVERQKGYTPVGQSVGETASDYRTTPTQIFGPLITTAGDVPGRLSELRPETTAKDIFSYQRAKVQAPEEAYFKAIQQTPEGKPITLKTHDTIVDLQGNTKEIQHDRDRIGGKSYADIFSDTGLTTAEKLSATETKTKGIAKEYGELVISKAGYIGSEWAKGTLQLATLPGRATKYGQDYLAKRYFPEKFKAYSQWEQKQFKRVSEFDPFKTGLTLEKSELGKAFKEAQEFSKPTVSGITTASIGWATLGTGTGVFGPTAQALTEIGFFGYGLKKTGEFIKEPSPETGAEATLAVLPSVKLFKKGITDLTTPIRDIGVSKIKPSFVFAKEVLSGKKRFPLGSLRQTIKEFSISKKGVHTTAADLGAGPITVERGTSAMAGLHVSPFPRGSPYFLRTSGGSLGLGPKKISLLPTVLESGTPQAAIIEIGSIGRVPKSILRKGPKATEAWLKEFAKPGEAYITGKLEATRDASLVKSGWPMGGEAEAVIPPEQVLYPKRDVIFPKQVDFFDRPVIFKSGKYSQKVYPGKLPSNILGKYRPSKIVYDPKKILVFKRTGPESTILHELGHKLDLEKVGLSTERLKIPKTEQQKLYSYEEYFKHYPYTSRPAEVSAEVFKALLKKEKASKGGISISKELPVTYKKLSSALTKEGIIPGEFKFENVPTLKERGKAFVSDIRGYEFVTEVEGQRVILREFTTKRPSGMKVSEGVSYRDFLKEYNRIAESYSRAKTSYPVYRGGVSIIDSSVKPSSSLSVSSAKARPSSIKPIERSGLSILSRRSYPVSEGIKSYSKPSSIVSEKSLARSSVSKKYDRYVPKYSEIGRSYTPPPPPPTEIKPFYWKDRDRPPTFQQFRIRPVRQPKVLTPTGRASLFGIKGKTTRAAELTGLGARPIQSIRKKKKKLKVMNI